MANAHGAPARMFVATNRHLLLVWKYKAAVWLQLASRYTKKRLIWHLQMRLMHSWATSAVFVLYSWHNMTQWDFLGRNRAIQFKCYLFNQHICTIQTLSNNTVINKQQFKKQLKQMKNQRTFELNQNHHSMFSSAHMYHYFTWNIVKKIIWLTGDIIIIVYLHRGLKIWDGLDSVACIRVPQLSKPN